MLELIPTLLEQNREDFEKNLHIIEQFAPLAQIDVMDGSWLPHTSWHDPDLIANMTTSLKFELHLMIKDPLAELEKWSELPSIKRVFFHIETASDPRAVIEAIRFRGWKVGVAINPETPLTTIDSIKDLVDEVMFMTVEPGKNKAKFVPATLKKISEFAVANTLSEAPQKIFIGVDGGVGEKTIADCVTAGVSRLRLHSAIFNADVAPADAYKHLYELAIEAQSALN